MFTVLLRGLEFYAHHGVPAEERVIGHRYSVDLEIDVEGDTDTTDDIAQTVDYAAAAQAVLRVSQGHRWRTVERLARAIGEQLMKEHVCIRRLTITLVKRLPPAPVIAEAAGVRLTLER